jgi:hypothetical protein
MRPLPCGPQQDVAESSPGKFLLQGRLDAKTLRPRWGTAAVKPGSGIRARVLRPESGSCRLHLVAPQTRLCGLCGIRPDDDL